MIPTFPRANKKIKQNYEDKMRSAVYGSILGVLRKKIFQEGDKYALIHSDGTYDSHEFQRVESSFSIKDEELPNITEEEIATRFSSVGRDLKDQMERHLFDEMHNIVEKNGNTVDARGETFSLDHFLQVLEKIEISFNGFMREKPNMPFIVSGPPLQEKIEGVFSSMSEEDKRVFEGKLKLILDRKFDAFMADVNSRTLSD